MSDTKECPMPVPLLAATLGADTRSVMLAYGNHLHPAIERVVSTHVLIVAAIIKVQVKRVKIIISRPR